MEAFEYYNPVRIVFGENKLQTVGKLSKPLGKKALIVSYKDTSFFSESLAILHKSLAEEGIEAINFFGVTANPTLSQAKQGIALCKEHEIDFVIGFGGGSVMDAAKVIAAGVLYTHDLRKMITFSHSDTHHIVPEVALPMVLIPTLPATGSEMNCTAVITDEETLQKSYVYAPLCLYAKVAIIDPVLTQSLPEFQTAAGAIDTIAHIAESYFNGTADNLTLQDNLQEAVIKTVLQNLPIVLENPNDTQARGVLLWAATLALNGWLLSGTYTWAPMHQMSHVISARYNATHGATLGTMILAWLKFYEGRENNHRFQQFTENIFGLSLEKGVQHFEKLLKEYGLPTSIAAFGITAEDIQPLVEDVVTISFNEENQLASHPPLHRSDITEIYNISLQF